jgi:hypothetical protein
MQGVVNERREVIDGLSVNEARECLALMSEEDLRHFQSLHELPDAPVGPDSPGRHWLSKFLRKLPDDELRQVWEQVLNDGKVHSQSEIVRKIAYRYRDDKVHEILLQSIDSLDKHWRKEHPDEPEPGDEYLRRAVTEVRQHRR